MKTDWPSALKPLLARYKGKPHPLEYKNLYQLLVMVILSAQDSDNHINKIAPGFFKLFPNLKSLAKADSETLAPLLRVRNARNKINWLLELARVIKDDRKIPLTMEELTSLPGIGRKSANVIMREAKVKAEGVMVDLHVVRVAPRLGITHSTDPRKIEADIMEAIPQNMWGEAGMAISFLGRETCRPTNPHHQECVMKDSCAYYHNLHSRKGARKKSLAKSTGMKNTVTKTVSAKKDADAGYKMAGSKRASSQVRTLVKKATGKMPGRKKAPGSDS